MQTVRILKQGPAVNIKAHFSAEARGFTNGE
jgi:hypothetical protein